MIAWGHQPYEQYIKYEDTMRPAPTAGTPKYPNGSPYSGQVVEKYPNGSPYNNVILGEATPVASNGILGEATLTSEPIKPKLGSGGRIVPVTREEYDILAKIIYHDATYENGGLSNLDVDILSPIAPYVGYEGGATKIQKDVKNDFYRFQLDEDVAHSMVREPV